MREGIGDTVLIVCESELDIMMRSAKPNIWALCMATAKLVGDVTRVTTGAIQFDGVCLV
jgi:hypothetical protein